jgi:hypothetical protein
MGGWKGAVMAMKPDPHEVSGMFTQFAEMYSRSMTEIIENGLKSVIPFRPAERKKQCIEEVIAALEMCEEDFMVRVHPQDPGAETLRNSLRRTREMAQNVQKKWEEHGVYDTN